MWWTRTKDNVHRRNIHTHTHTQLREAVEKQTLHTLASWTILARPPTEKSLDGNRIRNGKLLSAAASARQATLVDAGQDFRFSRQKRDRTVPLISCSNISTYTQTDRHDGRADGVRHSGGLLVHPAQLRESLTRLKGHTFPCADAVAAAAGAVRTQ